MAEATISILDWSLLRPGAISGVAHVWHDQFSHLKTHIARFQTSIGKLRLIFPSDACTITCARTFDPDNVTLKRALTGGHPRGHVRSHALLSTIQRS